MSFKARDSRLYGVRSGTKSIIRFRGLRNTSSLRKLFFESLSVVFVASVPCLRVVASLVSSYCFLRGIVCCLRAVGSMSSSRRIPRFIVLFSSRHCLLSSCRRFHVFESSHPSFHRTVFFKALSVVFVPSVPCLRVVVSLVSSYRILRHFYVFVSFALPFVDCATYLTAVLKSTFPAFVAQGQLTRSNSIGFYYCWVTSHDQTKTPHQTKTTWQKR